MVEGSFIYFEEQKRTIGSSSSLLVFVHNFRMAAIEFFLLVLLLVILAIVRHCTRVLFYSGSGRVWPGRGHLLTCSPCGWHVAPFHKKTISVTDKLLKGFEDLTNHLLWTHGGLGRLGLRVVQMTWWNPLSWGNNRYEKKMKVLLRIFRIECNPLRLRFQIYLRIGISVIYGKSRPWNVQIYITKVWLSRLFLQLERSMPPWTWCIDWTGSVSKSA